MYKYIVWDFDGTLINSYPEIKRIYKEILDSTCNVSDEDLKTIYDYMIRYSSKETKEFIHEKYNVDLENFEKMYKEKSISKESVLRLEFLDNAKSVVKKLYDKGYKNYIVTNRDETAVEAIDNLGASEYFEEIMYNGKYEIFNRKPDPKTLLKLIENNKLNCEEILYIGDRDLDIETCNNAGIDCAIYKPIIELKYTPKYIISDFNDIFEIIK